MMNPRLFAFAFFILLVGSVSASVNLTQNLFAYWAIDEGSGTHIADALGVYNATMDDSSGWGEAANDATDYSLEMNKDNHILLTTLGGWGEELTGEISASIWVHVNETTSLQRIWGVVEDGVNEAFQLATINTLGLSWYIRGSGGTTVSVNTPDNVLTLNTWHHIVVTSHASEGEMSVFVDGIEQNVTYAHSGSPSTFNNLTYELMLGGRNFRGDLQEDLNGGIAQLGFWSGVRFNQTHVDALYNNGSGLAYPFSEEPEPEFVEVVIDSSNGTGSWSVPAGVTEIDVLVVGGGGAGGARSGSGYAGGGGAGGLVFVQGYDVSGYGSTVSFSVGSGGAGTSTSGNPGSNSVFGNLTAIGGGQGIRSERTPSVAAGSGGSGGGGNRRTESPTATGTGGASTQTSTNDGYANTGFGNAGANAGVSNGGGGGGAGGAASAATGGLGMTVWGTLYAKGGDATGGSSVATMNTGSGGRGASGSDDGESGSDGIIIIRYVVSPVLVIEAKDAYDDTTIQVFSANITNTSGTYTFSTTNGTINTGIPSDENYLVDVVVSSEDYLTSYYPNTNMSSTLESSLAQAYVIFSCYEIITNQSLECEMPGVQAWKAGSHDLIVNVTGYYPVNTSFNVTAISGSFRSIPIPASSFSYEGELWVNPEHLNDADPNTVATVGESENFEDVYAYWNYTGNYQENRDVVLFSGHGSENVTIPSECALNPRFRVSVRVVPDGGVVVGGDTRWYCHDNTGWYEILEVFSNEVGGINVFFPDPIQEFQAQGFFDYNLTISAKDFEENPESDFTVLIESPNIGYSTADNANGTTITYSLLSGYNYSVILNATSTIYGDPVNQLGYANLTNTSTPPTSEEYEFNLSAARIVFLSLFYEENNTIFENQTTIRLIPISDSTEQFFEYETSSGNITIFNVPVGEYRVSFESEGYHTDNRFIDLRTFSSNNITGYFRENDTGEVKTFNVVDQRNIPQNGWFLKAQRYYNNTGWLTVSEGRSNIDGTLLINLLSDEFYRIILLDDSFTVQYTSSRTFLPASTYEVSPSSTTATNSQIITVLGVQTDIRVRTHANGTVYFEADGVSTSGSRDWTLELYRYYRDGPVVISTSSASGDAVTLSVDVPNTTARYEAVLNIAGSKIPVASLGYTWGGGPQVIGRAGGIFAFILLIAIIGVGAFSAPVAIVMSIIGLIVANLVGIFSVGVAAIIGLVFAGGMILYRRNA